MVPIENEKKRVNWHKIRAEYIGGGISQRKLADKYGVSWRTLQERAKREGWSEARETACAKAVSTSCQRVADTAADNATLAANIKRQGLEILAALFADYATVKATEHRESRQGVTDIKRLRDLTAAYKDLTGDIVANTAEDNALLQSLLALERGRND